MMFLPLSSAPPIQTLLLEAAEMDRLLIFHLMKNDKKKQFQNN